MSVPHPLSPHTGYANYLGIARGLYLFRIGQPGARNVPGDHFINDVSSLPPAQPKDRTSTLHDGIHKTSQTESARDERREAMILGREMIFMLTWE